MGAAVADLPEELLVEILWQVQQSVSTRSFWSCLWTCRQWHRIGLPMVPSLAYSMAVVVDTDCRRHTCTSESPHQAIRVRSDFSLQGPTYMYLTELRSLTIHVLHIRIAVPLRPVGGDFFRDLKQVFRTTRKLTTFSLKFADEGWDFPYKDVPTIPQSELASLVAALPQSVVNLEIDTMQMDLGPDESASQRNLSNHLCYEINRIFPRLLHIRMRVRHLCPTLFDFVGSCRDFCPSSCSPGPNHSWRTRSMTFWTYRDETPDLCHFVDTFSNVARKEGPHFPEAESILRMRNFYEPRTYAGLPREQTDLVVYEWGQGARCAYQRRVTGQTLPALIALQCKEHSLIEQPLRNLIFWLGCQFRTINAYPAGASVHLAHWHLEGEGRWVQNGHRGSRHPNLDGNEEGKPLWREAYRRGTIACLFPHCTARCNTLQHLYDHQTTFHPEYPHEVVVNGAIPCPSIGCDRVGLWGFFRKSELEKHILEHHRKPCTRQEPPPFIRASKSISAARTERKSIEPACSKSLDLGARKKWIPIRVKPSLRT